MILKQYYLGCLSQASYLIGDEESGEAIVVDPRRDIDEYLADAEARRLKIRSVILTHVHADFVAGHLELRARTGAEILLGSRARVNYPFRPVRDGETLSLGSVKVAFLETPGHTLESICVVVFERGRCHAVLTGDTLFVGDVGRPDLAASGGTPAEELAGLLYDSIHGRLLTLPDETLVYPGHGAGSACGKNLGTETVTTIGAQRKSNDALKFGAREEFVRSVTAGQPEAPRYFESDVLLNQRERPILEETLRDALHPLPILEVLDRRRTGSVVLDVREPTAYAARHLRGSINVPLGGKFAFHSGTVVGVGTPIVLIADPGREREAALRLGRIGWDSVSGYLKGGSGAVPEELTLRTECLGPEDAARRLEQKPAPVLLDVRSEAEVREKRIPGSLNIPLQHLQARLKDIPRERQKIVYCHSGQRSSIAASLLEREDMVNVATLAGGLDAWEAVGGSIER
jgi:glyoxylase-like metal-dependent hydrolase (beta-lactamase superfamily II)/rhodanese-related sulfurtransferase